MKNKTRCSFLCSRSGFRTVTAFLCQILRKINFLSIVINFVKSRNCFKC
nr:MAG TPA: hypothetical protein [Bacteriophage sp.]